MCCTCVKKQVWALTDNVVELIWQHAAVHPVLITEAATQLPAGRHLSCWHQVLEYLACVDVRCRPEQSRLIKVRLVWVIKVEMCSMRQYHLHYITSNEQPASTNAYYVQTMFELSYKKVNRRFVPCFIMSYFSPRCPGTAHVNEGSHSLPAIRMFNSKLNTCDIE